MKAFMKWWRKYWLTNMCGSRDHILARLAWRAALEELLEQERLLGPNWAVSWAKKELEKE